LDDADHGVAALRSRASVETLSASCVPRSAREKPERIDAWVNRFNESLSKNHIAQRFGSLVHRKGNQCLRGSGLSVAEQCHVCDPVG
jgi:hypothetical protein